MSGPGNPTSGALAGRAIAVSVAAALLTGCVAEGDFGRAPPSSFHQRLGLSPYSHVPGFAGHHDREIPLTEAERELRAHAYSLTFTFAHAPTHGHWSEYDPVIPKGMPADRFPDAERYVKRMVTGGYRSAEAMMNAIVDDVRADLDHVEAFYRAAKTVYATDAARILDLERIGASEPSARTLTTRVADNRYVIEQALVALAEKIAGYEQAVGEVMLAGGLQSRPAAYLEVEGLKRRTARLDADLRHLDGRYALTLPREPVCLEQSLAHSC